MKTKAVSYDIRKERPLIMLNYDLLKTKIVCIVYQEEVLRELYLRN